MIECPRCRSWEFLDVSTFGERPSTSLMCAECGTGWKHVPCRPASPLHSMEGPSVSTAEDILNGAVGLLL